jgi:hypothetical protein
MGPKLGIHRARWAAIGAAVAVTLGAGGIGIVRAAVDSGDRAVFVSIVPCRLVDTRPAPTTVGDRATPLGAETATFTVHGSNGNCSIPSRALSVVSNVTVVDPTADSYMTVFAADVARPSASNVNWSAGQQPTANAVTVDLSAAGAINLFNEAGTVDVIIDIVGYFEDHDHDDRYYTEAEVDALVAAAPGGSTGPAGPPGPPGAPGTPADMSVVYTKAEVDTLVEDRERDTLAELSCTTNQSVGWDGAAWVCRSAPITATLSANPSPSECCSVQVRFQAFSPNVNPNNICDLFFCRIELVDVLDHTSCAVSLSGDQASGTTAFPTVGQIDLTFNDLWFMGESLFVNVSCVA